MIRLNDSYMVDVTSQSYNLMVPRGKNKEDGTPRWVPVGYYVSLGHAITACVRDMTRRRLMDGEYELKEAIEIIREQGDLLREMLEKAGLGDD